MPLAPGNGRSTVSHNISEMVHAGYPQRQAVAASLSNADRHPRALGGLADAAVPHLAPGGFTPASPIWEAHQASRELQHDTFHPGGLFGGSGAGRTDRLPHAVAADSFVVPADVVSGLGQGSTLAGAKIMDGILSSGPFGTPLPRGRRADGGSTGDGISHVMVASGEYNVPRDKVAELGNRMRRAKKSTKRTDLEAGHKALRGLVEKVRSAQKKFLATAPKPKA